jgi:hypothetical protein
MSNIAGKKEVAVSELSESVGSLPHICGEEERVSAAREEAVRARLPEMGIDFGCIKSAFAIALHMHQPLIPAGGTDLGTAEIISNLKHMMVSGDGYNAERFRWCYKRMGEFIPQLVDEGKEPRVMLEYSGTLLHGLRAMGASDTLDALKNLTANPVFNRCVEWLGCPWGHAVAPSTPAQDYRLHVEAWQQHFAAIFGLDALARVRGFSPSEMALPNNPDVAYEYIKTLKACGYQWLLVQEHTVECPENGQGPEKKHLPHRLVCRDSRGECASIIALIKTQGSDTKLVGQIQPYYEAKELCRWELAGHSVPPLVTQIADGENGGVMMNEFPAKFMEVMHRSSGSETPAMNGTEYIERLFAAGIGEGDLPELQPILQKRIWDRFPAGAGPEKMNRVIADLKREDDRFHMEGGSWTNNISWVQGYDDVLGPMEKISVLFNEKVLTRGIPRSDPRFRNALFHLLLTQTSCFRYWGHGIWTEYAKELCRRASEVLTRDF